MAPVTPYLVSNFSGADENPLSEGGMWMKWWPGDDALRKVSQTASGQGVSTGYASSATVDTYPADIELSATVASRPTHSAAQAIVIGARLQDAGLSTHSGYMGAVFTGASNDSWRIYKVTNGSATVLVQGNATKYVVGDKIGLKLSGTTIELWYWSASNSTWTLRQSTTDSTYSGDGAIGLEASGTTPSAGAFDDFYSSYQTGGGGQAPSESDLGPKWMNNVLFSTTGGMEVVDNKIANKVAGPCEATYVAKVDRGSTNPAGIGIEIDTISAMNYLDAYLISSGRDDTLEGYRFRIENNSWSVHTLSGGIATELGSAEWYPTIGDHLRFYLTPTNVVLQYSSDGTSFTTLFDEANVEYTGEFTGGYVFNSDTLGRLDNAYITTDSLPLIEGYASDSISVLDSTSPYRDSKGTVADIIVVSEGVFGAREVSAQGADDLGVGDSTEAQADFLSGAGDPISVSDGSAGAIETASEVGGPISVDDEASLSFDTTAGTGDSIPLEDDASSTVETAMAGIDSISVSDEVGWGEGYFTDQASDLIVLDDRVHSGQIGFADDSIAVSEESHLDGEFGDEIFDALEVAEHLVGGVATTTALGDSLDVEDLASGVSIIYEVLDDEVLVGESVSVTTNLVVPITDSMSIEDSVFGSIGEAIPPEGIHIFDFATPNAGFKVSAGDTLSLIDSIFAEVPSRADDDLVIEDLAVARVDFHESVAQWISVIDIYTYGRLGKFVQVVEVDPEIQNDLWGSNAKFL